MIKNKKRNSILLAVAVVLFVIILFSVKYFGRQEENANIVGVIMPGSIRENGWNNVHYEGISAACEELGVSIRLEENVSETYEECAPAIEKMAKEGANIIILVSYNYPQEVGDVIKSHPEITFCCCDPTFNADNYCAYFARIYQTRYLAGIIAGLKTETNNIGYIAAMDTSEVNRGINAFALGVHSVNPEANVFVFRTNSWDNAEKEKDATDKLVKGKNTDIVTYHQNQTNVIDEAEKLGIYSIGYHEVQKQYSEKYLTSVICDWTKVYREVIKECIQGKVKTNTNSVYWVGMEKEAVSLSEYSPALSESIKADVQQAADKIISGMEIFSGEIYDNQGTLRSSIGEAISDEILLNKMDWLVEGVYIYEE
ncbi:MAG: BMP family ABC transporter substrate-binding protein [Lachnospira sp.]|nr:BMP family ABC transporter substrate-binding protein [Lachnospira sp.]